MMMMMDHDQEAVLDDQKPEACGLRAGVEPQLGLVTVQGNKTTRPMSDRIGSTRNDLVAAVASFGVHRKKRMARQRRSSALNLLQLSFSSTLTTATRSASHVPPPTLPLARVIDPRRLTFLFQKELKNSDVSSLRRMILPKKAAETHLPVLESKEGILISMDDLDGLHVWSFKYRFWPNNNSRMYVLENTGEFVIEGKKAIDEEIYSSEIRKGNSSSAAVVNEVCVINNEYEANNYCTSTTTTTTSTSSFYMMNYPLETTSASAGMSFVYDTTTNFSNESLLDFLGGSTNYSRNGSAHHDHLETFGSVDNFSCLDDFY
ncbi:hypothetical protein FNV43_RR22392 [Rhamnella rubrinervis]|uniref:TF-B3 domain-containing protein n=1 Tax=Rhamnella rubrinervis TaxID=2594499 RepID=A0A8K0DQE1_9ROSA|nr:hypothetical protein FNV43_RR22392 [Rhamnella rubrinervis]